MNNKAKKIRNILMIITVAIVCLILAGVINYHYHVNWILGKTSIQVEERYGAFDYHSNHAGADGLYRRAGCAYFVTPKYVGFFGTYQPYMFTITFNADGIAVRCYFQPGGIGG